MKLLSGHLDHNTAKNVGNYPYGRLRTDIKYWIEFRKGFGFRFVSQTRNPKKPVEFWNKPHPSTYHGLAIMTEQEEGDENPGYIYYVALSSYPSEKDLQDFFDRWDGKFPTDDLVLNEAINFNRELLKRYIAKREAQEKK